MYSIFDVNGFKDDFGSTFTVAEFYKLAKQFNLEKLKSFFEEGFSVDIRGLKSELEKIDFGFSELAEVKDDFLYILDTSEEIVVLSDT